jgi:putative PIN family toxin of toxin-antitoxin system
MKPSNGPDGDEIQLRVVIDTNVLVRCLVFRGGYSWIRGLWESGEILPLRSSVTEAELVQVLAYPKFRLTSEQQTELLNHYRFWSEAVTVPDSLIVPDCRDFQDRPFLELALAGHADFIVTGDDDLHALAAEFPIPIINPGQLRTPLDELG